MGAVLFAVEITATFFFVTNLWRAFFCSVICMLCLRYWQSLHAVKAFDETDLPAPPLNEVPHFALLGLVCGVIGGAFIWA